MTVSPVVRARRAARPAVTVLITAAMVGGVLTASTVSAQASAAGTRVDVVNSAAGYAKAHGYQVGISVLDTRTGSIYHSGQYQSGFASESLIKVMIAARLIVQGRMHGSTATRASRMIRMSDDNIANSFYGSVGGDGLVNWTKKYFKVPSLGTGPIRSGWWGSNRLTSDGLVRLYAKLKADKRIGPWLLRAMHGHTTYGADGFYQAFGIPSATGNAAVKQGWGADYSYQTSNASQNSTGFVNGDRYAVAILARGPGSSYGSRLGNAITAMAKRLLPNGAFPDGVPAVTSLTAKTGSTTGGERVGVRGRDFIGVTGVLFGSTPARFTVQSTTYVIAYVPRSRAGTVTVRVRNAYGTSSASGPRFTYWPPPVVTGLSTTSGPTSGGNIVSVRGTNLANAVAAYFGTVRVVARQVSSGEVTVQAPKSTATSVYVRVQTAYGVSAPTAAGRYTYAGPSTGTPTTSPTQGPTQAAATSTSGGTAVTSTSPSDTVTPSSADGTATP